MTRQGRRVLYLGMLTLIGVPTVGAFALYVWLFAQSMLRQPTWEHLITLLSLWQTQTGAAFALAAAVIGAIAIMLQTETTERQEERRRKHRADALRAVLPLKLSELTDYAMRSAERFAGVLDLGKVAQHRMQSGSANWPWIWPVEWELPLLPVGLVDQLRELIEASAPDHAKPLISLVQTLQLQHARAQDLRQRIQLPQPGQIVVRTNVLRRVIDAAEVHAWCANLFTYTRGDAEAPAAVISANDLKRAVSLMLSPDDALSEELGKEIDRYMAN